jgi:hypothetical protein
VLLATTARDDHLGTLVVFGTACHRFGHEVVAAPELFAAAVQRVGFAHAPFSTPVPAARDAVSADISRLVPHEASVRVMRDLFARDRCDGRLAGPARRARGDIRAERTRPPVAGELSVPPSPSGSV